LHYTLLRQKKYEGHLPMMQIEVSCPECKHNGVETYEKVPNHFFDDDE